MHLVDISLFYAPESGGVKTYLTAKARWMKQNTRIRHSIVAPSCADAYADRAVVRVPSVPIPFANGYRMPRSVKTGADILRRLKSDCIEVGDPYQFAWAALQIKRETQVPVVAFYHSDLMQVIKRRFGTMSERAAVKYVRHLYREFDLVLGPSQCIVQRLQDIGVERVRHQPLGVDTRVFTPALRNPVLRRRLALPKETRLLVYAGRFAREKKLPLLIQAVERLGPPYHLLMIGSGDKLPSSSQVSTIPFQQDAHALASLIASCDVLVHPGDQETFGLTVLEAMACGIPVVGVAQGGVAELVDDDTGILVPDSNVMALMQGISGIYDCDIARLGANARRKMEAHYDWNQIVPQLLSKYASLFSSARQRAEFCLADA